MRDLRLIGVHEGGQHLTLADDEGVEYLLPLDDALRAATRPARPRQERSASPTDPQARPRDIQALIRSGLSAEEVAERTGWPVEKIERYEGPVLAEREHVAGLAQQVRLRSRGGSGASPTLTARVDQRLTERGVEPAHAAWDAARSESGLWTVSVRFPAGGRERLAQWGFDPVGRTVTARNDEARWLSEDDAGDGPLAVPHHADPSARETAVYDAEAEGGVRATGRPDRAKTPPRELDPAHRAAEQAEPPAARRGAAREGAPTSTAGGRPPLDLMSAMREKSGARNRRGSRRRKADSPTQLPGIQGQPEDALPLEELAVPHDEMSPPPPARGTHPRDAQREQGATGQAAGTDSGSQVAADHPSTDGPSTHAPQDDAVGYPGSAAETSPTLEIERDEPTMAANDGAAQADSSGAGDTPSEVSPAQPESTTASEPTPEPSPVQPEAATEPTPEPEPATRPEPEPTADRAQAGEKPKPAPARKGQARKGRPSVPSWDDIMFGPGGR